MLEYSSVPKAVSVYIGWKIIVRSPRTCLVLNTTVSPGRKAQRDVDVLLPRLTVPNAKADFQVPSFSSFARDFHTQIVNARAKLVSRAPSWWRRYWSLLSTSSGPSTLALMQKLLRTSRFAARLPHPPLVEDSLLLQRHLTGRNRAILYLTCSGVDSSLWLCPVPTLRRSEILRFT